MAASARLASNGEHEILRYWDPAYWSQGSQAQDTSWGYLADALVRLLRSEPGARSPFSALPVIGLVIFDCDGVLVDSERLAVKIDVQVLARLGWVLTEEEVIRRFVGVSDAHFRREVEQQLGRSLGGDWEAEFQPLYREAYETELRPVEGIVEALERIAYPTCVASSGTHEKMRLTLGLTGLYERFAGRIFSATEVARGKPAPDLFLHAAERMGVHPSRCVVVEDSAHGTEAARVAGMWVLAYGGGVTPAEKLRGHRTTVFFDMRELPELLREVEERLC